MKRVVLFAVVGLVAGVFSPAARAQPTCTSQSQCEKACPTSGCTEVPPAMLIKDPGPEPPKSLVTLFEVSDQAWTAKDNAMLYGWGLSKESALKDARSAAENKAAQQCSAKQAKLEKVTSEWNPSPCKSEKDFAGHMKWNCHMAVKGDCRQETPNPAHAQWQLDSEQKAKDERTLEGLKRNYATCGERAVTARKECLARCAAECRLPSSTGESPDVSGGGTGGNAGTGAGSSTTTGPQPTKVEGTVETGLQDWQKAQMTELAASQAQLQKNSAELAEMTSKVPPKTTLIGLVGGLSAPFVLKLFASNALTIGVGLETGLITFLGIAPALTYYRNPERHERIKKNYEPAIAAASERCQAGEQESCDEANELVDAVHDAASSGGDRRRDWLSLGPRWQGPVWGTRYTASFVSESASSGDLVGDHRGGSTRSMMRVGPGLVGLDIGFRSVDNEGDTTNVLVLTGTLGLQFGSGLLSPYGNVAGRVFIYDSTGTADLALELGNTFDLTPLWSTAGPYVVAPTLDVAMTIPTTGDLEPGVRIGLGLNTANFWPEKVEDFDMSTGNRPKRPMRYLDPISFLLLRGGGGLQVLRVNGMNKSDHTIMTGIEGWFASDENGYSWSASMVGMGWRWMTDDRQLEWGAVFGLAGGQFSRGVQIAGYCPTKLFVRYTRLPIDIEVGAVAPLIWANTGYGEGESFALYEGNPLKFYLGLGFPMAMPEDGI